MRFRPRQLFKVLVAVCLIISCIIFVWMNILSQRVLVKMSKDTPFVQDTSIAVVDTRKKTTGQHLHETTIKFSGNPVILLWYKPFGHAVEYLANPEVCGENITCDVVYDRNLLSKAESVVFHFNSLNRGTFPDNRYPHQLYAWWTGEKTKSYNLQNYDNFFNLTFTYRFDSDVYAPYGSIHLILYHISQPGEASIDELLERKRQSGKVAVWAVSNCGVTSRMQLTKELEENGVETDKFGKCFHRQIGKGTYSKEFYDEISYYKFYFAFENGYHCKDYITEKFWFNALRSGAVPVVFGAKKEDILKVAPTKSFIHVDEFDSVKELADYLKYLSVNETAYSEYLEWRKWKKNPDLIEPRLKVENMNNDLRSFCSLCKIIMENRKSYALGHVVKPRVIKSLHDFWVDQENPECGQ